MSPSRIHLSRLIVDLRALAARRPGTSDEKDALIADCTALQLGISLNGLASVVPESVWHFLSDADIRFKDPRYASAQLSGFGTALDAWERALLDGES